MCMKLMRKRLGVLWLKSWKRAVLIRYSQSPLRSAGNSAGIYLNWNSPSWLFDLAPLFRKMNHASIFERCVKAIRCRSHKSISSTTPTSSVPVSAEYRLDRTLLSAYAIGLQSGPCLNVWHPQALAQRLPWL